MVALSSMANNTQFSTHQKSGCGMAKASIKQAKHMAVSLKTSLGPTSLCDLDETIAWLF